MQKMTGNKQFSSDVIRLYETLQEKREKLQAQLVEVEREFQAVATTLKLMNLQTPGMLNINLVGMTQLDALIAIAKANDNTLAVKTARRLMINAGLFKNPTNASSSLFTTIARSGRFTPVSKGVYRLNEHKEAPKPTPIPDPVALVDHEELVNPNKLRFHLTQRS
jgi:hypothetical protein